MSEGLLDPHRAMSRIAYLSSRMSIVNGHRRLEEILEDINAIARHCGPSLGLRDQIAIAVAAGLCSNPSGPFQSNPISGWGLCNCDESNVATTSYRVADAMLAERAKGGEA